MLLNGKNTFMKFKIKGGQKSVATLHPLPIL